MALEIKPTFSLGTTMVQAVKFYFLSLLVQVQSEPYWLHRFGEIRNFGVVVF